MGLVEIQHRSRRAYRPEKLAKMLMPGEDEGHWTCGSTCSLHRRSEWDNRLTVVVVNLTLC